MHCAQPFETVPGGKEVTYQTPPVRHFYVGNAGDDKKTWSVYWNGSGVLSYPASLQMSGNKKYAKTDIANQPYEYGYQFNASYYFTDTLTGACGGSLDENTNTLAVAYNLYNTEGHMCGDKYYFNIPGLENTAFTVRDRGTFTVEGAAPDHFDMYVGIQDHSTFQASPLAQYDGQPVQIAKAQP
jgi:hypothetical protein